MEGYRMAARCMKGAHGVVDRCAEGVLGVHGGHI